MSAPLGKRAAVVGAAWFCTWLVTTALPSARQSSDSQTVTRAVAYLQQEVPRWRREHPCYSCHNNGDAARALIAASRRGHDSGAALADTVAWLSAPDRWDQNKSAGGFDDRPLARIQFAGGLTSASGAALVPQSALTRAAELVAGDQKADGSWRLDTSQSLGSPATYGTAVATWSALRTLRAARDERFAAAIARADAWVRSVKVQTVLDAAAVALSLDLADDEPAVAQRKQCLEILRKGQAPDGGWGPYVTSASEPFDTAVTLLALHHLTGKSPLALPLYDEPALIRAIDRGRAFLIRTQLDTGNWPETTRPANQESYAQRISTTAWALLALVETAGN
jgi:hypothetical protein